MLLYPYSQNCNEDIFMLINQFVFCPHINKDLCVTVKSVEANGMYVVSAKKFERLLEKGFFKDKPDVLKDKELWATVDGVLERSFDNPVEVTYCPVVFEATRQNLVALNILYKGAYSDIVDLTIDDLKEKYPLTSKWIEQMK
jgi:hypothetical protein